MILSQIKAVTLTMAGYTCTDTLIYNLIIWPGFKGCFLYLNVVVYWSTLELPVPGPVLSYSLYMYYGTLKN